MLDSLRSVLRFRQVELDPVARRLARAASVADLRLIAKRVTPSGVFDYIDGAAEDERTMAANAADFARIGFKPRVLRDVGVVDPSTTVLGPLPDTKRDLLAELQNNMDSVTKQWREGNLGGLWYPTLRAKDVALKLQQDHGTDISDDKQPELTSAVQRVTLSAWQIDAAGDLGNKEKISVLYEVFHAAVGEILGLYDATH